MYASTVHWTTILGDSQKEQAENTGLKICLSRGDGKVTMALLGLSTWPQARSESQPCRWTDATVRLWFPLPCPWGFLSKDAVEMTAHCPLKFQRAQTVAC